MDAVKFLIESGANVNIDHPLIERLCTKNVNTPLLLETIKILLEAGADTRVQLKLQLETVFMLQQNFYWNGEQIRLN